MNLSNLLYPLSVQSFEEDFLHQFPLYIKRSDPSYFADLVTIDDIKELITRRDFRYPDISLHLDSISADPLSFTRPCVVGGKSYDVVDMKSVLDLFESGYTIFFGGISRALSKLQRFSNQITSDVASPTTFSAFYTPANSRGFQPHFDNVDVHVIQLFGTKRWRVYNSPFPNAMITSDCNVDGVDTFLDVILEPGDSLYVPRGWVHAVETLDEASFHLTISVQPFTWVSVFQNVFADIRSNPGFCASVDIYSLDESSIRYRLGTLIQKHLDQTNYDLIPLDFKSILAAQFQQNDSDVPKAFMSHLIK